MNPMVDATPLLARAGGGINQRTHQVGADFGVAADVQASVGGGTNTRVAGALLLAGGVLALLKWAGFRFNVGVSN